MENIKDKNPSFYGLTRSDARIALSLPQDSFVVSLYSLGSSEFSQALRFLKQDGFLNKKQKTVILWTPNANIDVNEFEAEFLFASKGLAMVRLSNAGPLTMKIPGNVVIINDVKGRLHLAHAAADIAISTNEVNKFESLTAGTPTATIETQGRYNPKTIEHYKKQAAKTGAFYSTRNMSTIPFQELSKMKVKTPPFLASEDDGRPAFDHLLDQLEKALRQEIKELK